MTTFAFLFETQFQDAIQLATQITLVSREKSNYVVNYKRIITVDFSVTTYLVGRNNSYLDPRIRQTVSTKRTLREHDTENYYGK